MSTISLHTLEIQNKASNPKGSAFVSANAGSGKTFVLSRRVVRLLLSGCPPEKLLCLTFTKAAAAEMSNRVFKTLSTFALASDPELAKLITEIEGAAPDAQGLIRARRLFARALEAPGGLKIQTIHAFCEGLLQRFPLEANVAGRFEVLDDRHAAEWLKEAQDAVYIAASHDTGPLGGSFAKLLNDYSDSALEGLIRDVVREREALGALKRAYGGLEAALAALPSLLGVPTSMTRADVDAQLCTSPHFPGHELSRLIDLLDLGGKTDVKLAKDLRLALDPRTPKRGWLWYDLFFDSKGEARETLGTKKINDAMPQLANKVQAEVLRLMQLAEIDHALETVAATAALLTVADAVVTRFEARKSAQGALDFTDLIARTADLLKGAQAAAWVQYKLDQGLEHVLVDEAQDTSPLQWEVIRALTDEFFVGKSLRETQTRTVFAVGDEKQSIYSFQGARPETFAFQRRGIAQKAHGAAARFEDLKLQVSFRSVPEVVRFVDTVFSLPDAFQGLTSDNEPIVHETNRGRDSGRVELWPEITEPPSPERESWTAPVDATSQRSAKVQLAERIAETIATWLREGAAIGPKGARMTAGDILVLVRKRDGFVTGLSRALLARGVPVAGADRLVLSDHIVAQDFAALARAALNPDDDLTLATVLKSPFLGLDDEDLLALAPGRTISLRAALALKADDSSKYAVADATLTRLEQRAETLGPFAFFSCIAAEDRGRAKWTARLGSEADEVIDEFLNLCFAFEESEAPSLPGFLHWLAAARTEVKREMDGGRDEVRIMTVHGSKGLEAPVVFVVDPGGKVIGPMHTPKLMTVELPTGTVPMLLRVLPKDRRPSAVRDAITRWEAMQRDEYRRLFYVALTRARDRLVLCGVAGKMADKAGRWMHLAQAAFSKLRADGDLTERLNAEGESEAQIYQLKALPEVASPEPEIARTEVPLPLWLFERMELAAFGSSLLPPPSRPSEEERTGPDAMARALGTLVHRLIEILPEISPTEREPAARRIIAEDPLAFPAEMVGAMITEARAVLDHPYLADVFGPHSRAEVPITGMIDGLRINGRIDRMVVDATQVTIVDFKTTRPVPRHAGEIPPHHIKQLKSYGRLMAPLFAGKELVLKVVYSGGVAIYIV